VLTAAFRASRVSRRGTIVLHAPPDRVFPLFTPDGERKWAAGWDFRAVYPVDGEMEENFVFVTDAPDHAQAPTVWIVTRYEPADHVVEYQRVEPGIKTGRVRVRCRPGGVGEAEATVEYTYTALSEAGNRFVATFSAEAFAAFIARWAEAINAYLSTAASPAPAARVPRSPS
jgi:hypothetical protein